MANGKTHEAVGSVAAIPATIVAAITGVPLIPFSMGQFLGLFLASPDVDTHSRATKRWGVLGFIWEPLQSATKHRGITHHPLLGAPLVLGYLAAWGLAVVNVATLAWVQSLWLPEPNWEWCRWVLGGVYAQHWIHLAVDAGWSGVKKTMRGLNK